LAHKQTRLMFIEGVFIILIADLYIIPTIVAAVRRAPDMRVVILVNLFLGWTLIGWIVALGMARSTAKPPQPPPAAHVTAVMWPTKSRSILSCLRKLGSR
jgi:hypothetical protein